MSILSFLIGMAIGAIIIIAIVTRKPRKMSDYDDPEEYEDYLFCENCQQETLHTIYDSPHERDSSADRRECHNCKWVYSGQDGKYHPTIND